MSALHALPLLQIYLRSSTKLNPPREHSYGLFQSRDDGTLQSAVRTGLQIALGGR